MMVSMYDPLLNLNQNRNQNDSVSYLIEPRRKIKSMLKSKERGEEKKLHMQTLRLLKFVIYLCRKLKENWSVQSERHISEKKNAHDQ